MAISATTSVLTANDWQYAKDIRPGDWVFNRLGQPVKVKATQMYRSEECYRVEFDDNMTVDGDRHLTMPAEDHNYRMRATRYKGRFKRSSYLRSYDVVQMMETGLFYRGTRAFFSVPTTEPVQLPHQPLGIPPFVYGFWFFARKRYQILQVPVEFAEDTMQKFMDSGYKINEMKQSDEKYRRFRTEPSVWKQLLGQQTQKIPAMYLNGSPEQRLELLQGILSSKSAKTLSYASIFQIQLRKKQYISVIQYLAETLGSKTNVRYDKHTKIYTLRIQRFKPFLPQMAPDRKVAHLCRRYVKSIKPIPAQLCVHIETEEEGGSFLVNEGFISCH